MENPNPVQLSLFREQLLKYVVFNNDQWEIFKEYLVCITYKKKQHFLEAGTVCSYFGFLLKGSVRYYFVKDGTEITGYFSYENEFIGAYKSFLTGTPSLNYIQALEDSEIILINKADMDLMLDNPVLSLQLERLRRLMAEYIIVCYEDRASSFVTQTPEQRYLKLLETGKDILQKVPQHYIANYLGITAVSLSRIRKRIFGSR
ncbi:MAG: Crp/Fnr family transcriptional regulator [Flavobacterium sp.]